MTEINNTVRSGQQPQQQTPQRSSAQRGPRPTNASANRLPGLASGINTEQTIATIMQVERRRLEPLEDQKADTLQELQAFELVNQALENMNGTVESLKGSAIWEGKLIQSSDENVVTATATAGAKPGKHTLVVDRLALNHQIASQGYETPDDQVGTGRFAVTVGDGAPVTVVIDEAVNTLTGLKDAINFATDQVNATIIKTGSRTNPYQLVVTSQKTGSEGRLTLDVQLEGGNTPNFQNSVEEPSPWKGVGDPAVDRPAVTGTGASTAIVQVIGDYTGEEDNRFTFTAVQTGIVGGEKQLQVRWKDELGRSGLINLDALNYAPGEPLEFQDGLALVFSEGEVIVNDSFTLDTRAERSELVWWLSPEDRTAAVSTPSAWQRQQTQAFGAPVIEGSYEGEDEADFKLTIQGSGQVGRAESLSIFWEIEDGESGVLNIGQGYEPDSQLALTQGLTVRVKPGVLSDGQVATFEATPVERSARWWLPDEDRVIPSEILNVTKFSVPGVDEDEPAAGGVMPSLPGAIGPRVSTTVVELSGQFTGDEAKVFTFTAVRDGAVGTTKDMRIRWDDAKGNTGELSVGETYQPGTPLPFAEGLAVAFGPGRVFADDSFTVRTRTSTIQPPQDALIRFGATELGGGLEITSPTNELDGVIDGARLQLVTSSDIPVTITIRGDTEQAFESVKTFVDQYNELAAVIAELTKFEKETATAGPLLGDRDVASIQNTLAELVIDPVAGLPQSQNMLLSLGVAFNDKGFLDLDESVLQNKIAEDFALVADLFRNKGESDNANVAFVGMTDDTRISTDGYPVDITAIATQGHYETPTLQEPVIIDGTNNRFFINVDGRQSDQLTLEPGNYTLAGYARALQDAITNDDVVGERKVRVVLNGDRLRVVSGRFGSASAINFLPITGEDGTGRAGVGLLEGPTVAGTDVQGTINGNAGEGNGQLLRAPEGSGPAAGLRVFAKLSESQFNQSGPEASVVVTRGIASRVGQYLTTIVNPLNGEMKRITDGLRDQAGDLDEQLERMEGRIESKRKRLQTQFAQLESKMAKLRSQQASMQSQLGGSSPLPGLPGL